MSKKPLWLGMFILLAGVFFVSNPSYAQTSCALGVGGAYKTQNSNSVWAVTEGCFKRPILNPAVFFSHYSSWNDVQVVGQSALDSVARHPLNFLPWGPLRALDNGSLIKTVDDPNVYLKLGNRLHAFTDEASFYAFGYSFTNVEDVTAAVIAQHTVQAPISGIDSAPEGLVFKYPNAPQVYRLEKRASDGKIVKRHIKTFDEFEQIYRTNLLVDLPSSAVFEDLSSTDSSMTNDTNEGATADTNTDTSTTNNTNTSNTTDTGSGANDSTTTDTSNTNTQNTGTSNTNTTNTGTNSSGPGAQVTNPSSSGTSVGATSPYTTFKQSALTRPALGQSVVDPAFNTRITRVAAADANEQFKRHEYSQRQAFNSDESLIMLLEGADIYRFPGSGGMVSEGHIIVDAATFVEIGRIPGDANLPRWNPTNPDEVYFVAITASQGDPTLRIQIVRYNVRTAQRVVHATLPAVYNGINRGFTMHISNEELSRDGRWITMYVNTQDGDRAFIAYDLVNNQMGADIRESSLPGGGCSATDNDPNWVAPSPLGNYLVIQWNRDGGALPGRCEGVEVYDIQTGIYVGHVAPHRQHSDMGLDENGNEVYVTAQLTGSLIIALTRFPGSQNFSAGYDQKILDPSWYHMQHISCKGPKGLCVITADGGAGAPFGSELYLVYMNGVSASDGDNDGARVRRLAHHRSTSGAYWEQPQASISPNGSYVIFASDWGNANRSAEAYVIDLRNQDISAPAPVGSSSSGSTNTGTTNNTDTSGSTDTSNNADTNSGSNDTSGNSGADTGNSSGSTLSAEIDLGANGLPNSTYAAQGSDYEFTLGTWYNNPAEKDYVELLTVNYLGDDCSNVDFANIRFFIQENQTGTYSRIESSTYLETWDSGCGMKSNVKATVPLNAGTHNIVACAANEDFSNNYCTDPMVVATNPNGQSW